MAVHIQLSPEKLNQNSFVFTAKSKLSFTALAYLSEGLL